MATSCANVVYWPRQRVHAALVNDRHADPDDTIYLLGFRADSAVVCIVNFSRDRDACRNGLEVVGRLHTRSAHGEHSHRMRRKETAVNEVVAAWCDAESTPCDADSLDRSIQVTWAEYGTTEVHESQCHIVLYDPEMQGTPPSSERSASPLYKALEMAQSKRDESRQHQQHKSKSHGVSSVRASVQAVCEMVGYYGIYLTFTPIKQAWQVFDSLLSVSLLQWFPMGRGKSLKEYSQFLCLMSHRVSLVLGLPSQIRTRYRMNRTLQDGMRVSTGCSYIHVIDSILYLLVDYVLGLLISSVLFETVISNMAPDDLYPSTFLGSLRASVVWLMGAPAGFKLNVRLASILGNGILLWLDFWTFLFQSIVSSWLGHKILTSPALLVTGVQLWRHAGLTLQLSLVADVLWLVMWNSSWVYLYFTKLNKMQLGMLSSLWKLFLGKKNNVLRKRVDSCEYTVNQLLLGTLLFTILVFLVTTTTVFLVFFGLVRASVWLVWLALWAPIVALRGIPIASILHRVLVPNAYISSLTIEALTDQKPTSSLTLHDISAGKRRARDATDREAMRNLLLRTRLQPRENAPSNKSILFRVVARPSGFAELFTRLRVYRNEVAKKYSGRAIIQSCFGGGHIDQANVAILFGSLNEPASQGHHDRESKGVSAAHAAAKSKTE